MMKSTVSPIHVVGGGLAGSEAAWQAAQAGVPVVLHEMRGVRGTDAHKTDGLAELVCSNSFRSDDATANAVGVIHAEMRLAGSLIMTCADKHQVPAGGALAVDRDGFSEAVSDAIEAHPLITVVREEITGLPPKDWDLTIVATGPLTSPDLAEAIRAETGADALAFFDAIAPIIHRESLDMDICWYQSRYDKVGPGGTGKDYINCPMDEAQYNAFIDALIAGDTVGFKEWEGTPYFDGCLPIEVMAERGRETLRHGPMKPMGLTNAHNPTVKPYAVVQLRQDNALGTLYNMVGFQTKLRYGAQSDVFRRPVRFLPDDPRPGESRVPPPRGPASQYLHQFARAARSVAHAEEPAGPPVCRSNHRLRRLCRKRIDRAPRGPLRSCRAKGPDAQPAARDDGDGLAAQPHHRRSHCQRRRTRQTLVPANEHQFRAVPGPCPGFDRQAGGRQALPRQGQDDHETAIGGRAGTCGLQGLAGPRVA